MPDFSSRLPTRPSLEQLSKQAKELLRDFRAGETTAAERLRSAGSDAVTLADAQFVLAREYGFESWARLKHYVELRSAPLGISLKPPFYKIDWESNTIAIPGPLPEGDWDSIATVVKEHGITRVTAVGITDSALDRLCRVDHLTGFNFDGAMLLTDAGLAHLASLPGLEELNLSGWKGQITDAGLAVIRELPGLKRFQMSWQQNVSDAGVAHLAGCDHLESVDLMGTPTGDAAIRALTGKPKLRRLKTGRQVSDAGLLFFPDFPLFKKWHGGEIHYDLMSPDAGPTFLLVNGPFTNNGIAGLSGLDGLFGLSFFGHCPAFTGEGLQSLKDVPNLGFLGCEGKRCDDEAMRHIAAIPRLRMLMAQGTIASDAGFASLSRSQTIECIWGRECPNLTGRGFAALSAMPALRGLAVSCKNVDDAALSMLPRFPTLREFMPMDVSDEGFLHVGRCEQLERLVCMYCRDTGDLATENIAGLSRLKTYYAGKTLITDRSLEILRRMESLERLEFWACDGITDVGVAHLTRLPRLQEVSLDGLRGVTRKAAGSFPAVVKVNYSV